MTRDAKAQLARRFLSVLSAPDESVVKSATTADMIWSFPGSSVISIGLEEHLAAVFPFRDDKIARLDTFLSDVPMVEAFFG